MNPREVNKKLILVAITATNILNFLDRGIIPGATNEFTDFITNAGFHHNQSMFLGLLQSAFIIGLALSSLVFGNLVHHYSPFTICGSGMTIWIVAVVLSGLSFYTKSYICLFVARMLSGVGEASFQCSVAPWISKHASSDERGTWLSIFYTAVPVGTALGYAFSASLAESIGWQWAYFIEAAIMVPFVLFLLYLAPLYPCESKRAANDGLDSDITAAPAPSILAEARILSTKPTYICIVAGYAAQTGALIGVSTFGSAFLMGLGYFDSETQASSVFGVLVSVAGIIATPLGGIALDRLSNWYKNQASDLLAEADEKDPHGKAHHMQKEESVILKSATVLTSISSVIGGILFCIVYFVTNKVLYLLLITVACSFLFACYPGMNLGIMLSVPLHHRAFAVGMSTLCLHLFGDVPSPIIAGYIKDKLAPSCTASDDDLSGGGSVATSPACRHEAAGLRETQLIISLWLVASVIFLVLAYRWAVRNEKRLLGGHVYSSAKQVHRANDSDVEKRLLTAEDSENEGEDAVREDETELEYHYDLGYTTNTIAQ